MTQAGALIGRYMRDGNLAAAEYTCRRILHDREEETSIALLGLALLARRLGRDTHEALFLHRMAAPYATHFHPPLAADHIRPGEIGTNGGRPRYLVANAWGEGFWSDVSHVIGCCALAWATGRIPITNWRVGSRYNDRPSHDAFGDFFEPLGPTTVEDIDLAALSVFPAHWTAETLLGRSKQPYPDKFAGPSVGQIMLSDADVVVCDKHISPADVLRWIIPATEPTRAELAEQIAALLARCCRPRAAWRRSASDYVERTFGGRPYLAFHLRGLDKRNEHRDADAVARRIIETVEQAPADLPLFLMTDDEGWLDALVARFGARLHYSDARRGAGIQGLHVAAGPASRQDRSARKRLGGDILHDSLIAAAATWFVGDGVSNVSAMIDLMMPRTARVDLLCPNQLLDLRDWGIPW